MAWPTPWRAVTESTDRQMLDNALRDVTRPGGLLHGHTLEVVAIGAENELLLRLESGWLAFANRCARTWQVTGMFGTVVEWQADWLARQNLAERTAVWRSGGPAVHAEIRRRLTATVAGFIATSRRIDDATCLYHDLGMAGDDADEFLMAVHTEFGTSFNGLRFELHFPDEGDAFFYQLAGILGYRSRRFRPCTVGHLIAVIERGHWFEPESFAGP